MYNQALLEYARIAQDLQIRKVQVESVVQLLDQGNTIPFVARYRREMTGALPEDLLHKIHSRVAQFRHLADRKQTILKSIEGQGKLTEELRNAVQAADNSKRLEDLYLPYKPKKRSPASAAREKGLDKLALAIWNRDPAVANLDEVLPTMVNPDKELPTTELVLEGVQQLLAEQISELADLRAAVRAVLWDTGRLATSKNEALAEKDGLDYKDYFQFTEPIRQIPPHRILAINRGEKENALAVRLEFDAAAVRRLIFEGTPHRPPVLSLAEHPHAALLQTVALDAVNRLLLTSLEREIRRDLTERAQEHAIAVFARNLRSLLLQPPLRNTRVLAIDPGFRTGCRLAVLDETGNLLEETTVHPHPPQNKKDDAKYRLAELLKKHRVRVIAIGNGNACRETEELVADLIARWPTIPPPPPPPATAAPETQTAAAPEGVPPAAEAPAALPAPVAQTAPPPAAQTPAAPEPAPSETPVEAVPAPPLSTAQPAAEPAAALPPEPMAPKPEPPPVGASDAAPAPVESAPATGEFGELAYVLVNEAGASVYAGSPVGREEFPNHDASLRSTVSIGRRLQDPLAELVKIEPHNVGVGLYQHDVNPRHLKESLETVVESCVNHVGVDVNTASVSLLRHVSGLNPLVARELVEYRKQHGPFKNREQLRQLPSVGDVRFVQAAGFLHIKGGDNPFDQTWMHPETYPAAQQILAETGFSPATLDEAEKLPALREQLKTLPVEELTARLQIGLPTLKEIFDSLAFPSRDPRDELPAAIFRKGILKLEDLQPGMELKGTVLNVVDFGAFIDIGLKDSGLVHISQLANRYIKNPYDIVAVGDVVMVWVLTVDQARRRVSLTMIKPGTERKPSERKRPEARGERPPQRGGPPARGGRPPRGERPPRADRPLPSAQPSAALAPAVPAAEPAAPPSEPPTPALAPAAASALVPAPSHRPPSPAPRRQPPPPPPRRPHKPQRAARKPKLSQAALEGEAPLRSLGELAAFFEAKRHPPKAEPVPEQKETGPSVAPPSQ